MTPQQYAEVAEELKAAVALLREINEHHDPLIAAANKTHKLALAAKAKYAEPIVQRQGMASRLLGNYVAEQKRLADEQAAAERRRLQALADARKQEELLQQQALAEQGRAAERKRRDDAEAARQLAQEAADPAAAAALLEEADRHEAVADGIGMQAAYDAEIADQIAAAPAVAAEVIVSANTPIVAGVHTRETWHAEIVDKRKFLAHALANFDRYESYVSIELPALNRTATNVKKEIEIEPGVMARPSRGGVAKR